MKLHPRLFLILFIFLGTIFVVLLLNLLELESHYLSFDEPTSITLNQDTKYMVLVDDMFTSVIYVVQGENKGSTITYEDLPGYVIEIRFSAELDGGQDYSYIEEYGEYTSVTVNDFDGIGTIVLMEGTSEVEFTAASAQAQSMSDSFEFALIPSAMIPLLIFTILSGIATMIVFVVFLILNATHQKRLDQETYGYLHDKNDRTSQWGNKITSDQDLFEMSDDDIFADYESNKNNHSGWND